MHVSIRISLALAIAAVRLRDFRGTSEGRPSAGSHPGRSAAGGLPYLSHPHLSGVYSALMMDLDGLIGIELFNVIAGEMGTRGLATIHLDDLMAVGKPVWGVASDDRHAIDAIGPRAWVEVKADANERGIILEAMRQGRYYSATGPKIHAFRSTTPTSPSSVRKRAA